MGRTIPLVRSLNHWVCNVQPSPCTLCKHSPPARQDDWLSEPKLHGAGEAGNIWSFNYFLYNRKQKRVLYFSCRGVSKTAGASLP